MTVYLAQPPDGAFPSDLARFHRRDLRAVYVQAHPGDINPGAAAMTILESLGKRSEVAGGRDGAHDNVPWLIIWLRAHEVEWLILTDAQVYRPHILSGLLRVVSGTPVNVLVVPQRHANDDTMAVVRGYAPTVVPWTRLSRLLPKHDRTPTPPPPITPPTSDWYRYRADCRDLLTPDQHHALDRHYLHTLAATRRWLASEKPTETNTRAFLAQAVSRAHTLAEGLTCVRAAQAAFFSRGWNLRISQPRLMHALAAAVNAQFTSNDWAALRAYRPPYRSALVALHQAGVPLSDLMSLTIEDAAIALTDGHLGEYDLTGPARPFLAAQLLQRATEHARHDDSFIVGPARTPGDVINRASRDLGLLIGTHHAPTNPHTLSFWQFRAGLQIQPL